MVHLGYDKRAFIASIDIIPAKCTGEGKILKIGRFGEDMH